MCDAHLKLAIETMGDKVAARNLMVAAGLPVAPGTAEPLHDLVRDGLRLVLSREPDLEVVGEAAGVADAIRRQAPIEVYGDGRMRRDFTYIDDLVEAVVRLIGTPPALGKPVAVEGGQDSLSPVAPWRVVNVAGGQPVELTDFIAALESAMGRTAEKRLLPMQPGDVRETHAAPDLLRALTGYVPETTVETGVRRFVEWYRAYTA